MQSRCNSGFSLIELSIVLMVMGFLAGIVAMGKNLIHEASIQKAITELSTYRQFALQFKGRYQGWPGDRYDASKIWSTGAMSGNCPGDPFNPAAGGCNGNGDDIISGAAEANAGLNNNENLRAWQHLRLAGLITGPYAGGTAGAANAAIIGTTVPGSQLDNSVGFFYHNYTGLPQDNVVGMGGFVTNGLNQAPALTPYEAKAIDTKLDDGYPQPGRGEITTPTSQGTATSTSGCYNNTLDGGRYNVDIDQKLCTIAYKLTWRPRDAY